MADQVTTEARERVANQDSKRGQDKSRRNKENVAQGENYLGVKLHRLFSSNWIDIFLKVIFAFLSIPWFISIIFFSVFDTKCIVYERASVINCSQSFFISNPRRWIFANFLMSILSSFLLIFIVRLNLKKLNYQTKKAKKLCKKGYFGSLMFLLVPSLMYYTLRIHSTKSEATGMALSVLVFLWPLVAVLLVCCLNYLPRVHWEKTNGRRSNLKWWKECLDKNSNFIIYWLALLMYFFDVTCKVTAIMLDVAHDVAPLIENKFPDGSERFRGPMVIVIGFNMAFHARLLSFFWQKLFHGEKDLFTEPNLRLVEDFFVEQKQRDDCDRNLNLEEIIVNKVVDSA